MQRIRLAFLGAGDVAQRDYLPEIARLHERVELTAICGRGEQRARAVAAQYGFGAVYTDYHQMLAEAQIDAVVNLAPIQLHNESNLAILAAGKHLYSEKPLATTLAAAQQISTTAAARGLTVVCAPSVLLFPQLQQARQLLEAGAIGPVYSARGLGFGGVPPWHGYPSDPTPFFAHGGGAARDMGVYPMHAITGLLGPAQRVSALTAFTQRSFTVADGPYTGKEVLIEEPDNWHILLDLGASRLASVEANNCAQSSLAPQLELLGLNGTLAINLLDVSAPLRLWQHGNWSEIHMPPTGRASGPDHLLGVEHLVDCLEQHQTPVLSIAHAMHVIEIIELAALSATEGRTQALSDLYKNNT